MEVDIQYFMSHEIVLKAVINISFKHLVFVHFVASVFTSEGWIKVGSKTN